MRTCAGFTNTARKALIIASIAVSFSGCGELTRAQQEPTTRKSGGDETASREDSGDKTKPQPAPSLPEPKGAKRLTRDYPVWVDLKEKAVLVDGQIALRQGMLEMFACTRNTKEH